MWISQVKFNGKNAKLGLLAFKFKVDLFGFPISYVYEKNYILVNIAGNIFGTEENKKLFLKSLENFEDVINFEYNEGFIIGTLKES